MCSNLCATSPAVNNFVYIMDIFGEEPKYYLCNALSYVSYIIDIAYVIISLFYTIANKMFYFVIITLISNITSNYFIYLEKENIVY